jgi:hypothetical protein
MKEFEIFDKELAKQHVKKFKHDNPTKPNATFYEAHAISTTFIGASTHFPSIDFIDLFKIKPLNSIGIRLYIGDDGHKKSNFIVFTQDPASGGIPDDILENVYLLKNKFVDLKNLRKPKSSSTVLDSDGKIDRNELLLTFHLACDPDCPNISLYN